MNKVLKYTLSMGVALGAIYSGPAFADENIAAEIAETTALAAELAAESMGVPVVDIASGPAHIAVLATQELLREEVKKEKEIKEKIRPRVSVVYKPENSGEEAEGEGASEGNGEGNGQNKKKKMIDAKLSKIKIDSKEVTDIAGEGIAGTGVNDLIKTQGTQTAQVLVDNQQKKYVSSAGTEEGQELYERQRQYNEQEQAVQMIAYAATVRKNVNDTINQMVEKVEGNYDKSDGKKNCDNGCVKRDLDPENKEAKVHKNADYNQVLRQYAYYSLVYDQLLSLEQQIMGLRLQAKGAAAEQKSSVLSDVLEQEKSRFGN